MDKTQMIFRLDKKTKKDFFKKCSMLDIKASQYLRAAINVILNVNNVNEFEFKNKLEDKQRYLKLCENDRITETNRALNKIGVNLNQVTKSLNQIVKFPFLEDPDRQEILDLIQKFNNLHTEIIYTQEKISNLYHKGN